MFSTEPYQTTLPASTKTETQQTPMPKRYCHSAHKSQLYSTSHDQRELDTAQLIMNIMSYHRYSNQG